MAKLNRIHRASESAIRRFLKTETALLRQNEIIDAHLTKVDDKMARLQAEKDAAEARKVVNANVAGRIGEIVRGGNAE